MGQNDHDSLTNAWTDPRNPTAVIDQGPWGKSQKVVYQLTEGMQLPTTILEGKRAISPDRGEPPIRTFQLFVDRETQQEPTVIARQIDLADVNVVGTLDYGIGGCTQQVEFSIRRGTSVTVAATWWRLTAFIEPVWTQTGPLFTKYPRPENGPKTVTVQAACVLGSRQGGSIPPTRQVVVLLQGPDPVEIPIPNAAINVTVFTSDVVGELTIAQVETYVLGASKLPVQKIQPGSKETTLEATGTWLSLTPNGGPDGLVYVVWGLVL